MQSFRTNGTCSKQILFDIQDNKLVYLKFVNGCSGNGQGLSKILIGQDIDFIIERLTGIMCQQKTSCPDQLAKALLEYKTKMSESN